MSTPPVIDLRGDDVSAFRVSMVSRFPPSCSGGAEAALDLSRTLMDQFGVEVEVIRLVRPGDAPAPGAPVAMELNPFWRLSGHQAAMRASESDLLILRIEAEPPLPFADDLIDHSTVPVVLSLDDVPRLDQALGRAVMRIASRAAVVVVPTECARERLKSATTAGSLPVEVIPHGSVWSALGHTPRMRRRIVTWGFLTPDAGVERMIRALGLLTDLDPPPCLLVIGVAHPDWSVDAIARYRDQLRAIAQDAGVVDSVGFRPVLYSRRELRDELESSDVVAVTYDAEHKTASRIITEAIAAARPVVATQFPGAEELLRGGAGHTARHDDIEGLAATLRRLLIDDDAYRRAAAAARSYGNELRWPAVAGRYVAVLLGLLTDRTTVDSDARG